MIVDQNTTAKPKTFNVQFKIDESGTYTVHAAVDTTKVATDYDELTRDIRANADANTITVEPADVNVKDVTFTGADGNTTVDKNNQITFDQTPNNINAENVKVTVTSEYADGEGGTPSSEGVEITVENPYNNIHVLNDGKEVVDPVKADKNGEAEFAIVADYGISSGVYTLKFIAGDVTKELKVNIPDKEAEAQSIEAVKMENNVVSSDKTGTLEDAVQYVVKDADGNVINADDYLGQETPAVSVVNAPDKFDGTFTVAAAGADNDILTLSTDKTLPVGEYTVKVAIAKGANADATFEVKKFDAKNIVEMKLVATNTDVEKTSEVAMGVKGGNGDDSKYTIKPVWVDANGVTKDATANVGLKAGTVASDSGVRYSYDYKTLVIPALNDSDTDANNTALIGSVVTIQAVDPTNGFNISRDFTIVDPSNTAGVSLAFDSDNGSVEKNNKVEVTVVDADGNKTEIADTSVVNAYVADQSNEDAYVQASVTEYKDGKATLTVYADQETTADIVVYLVSGTGSDMVVYGGTLEYTFGEKAVDADTTVAMTIGSSDIIVNNDIVSGDAAPFVDSNWRTMVPVRALSEAFGGSAEWDGDARTVTVVNGDTTIVFNADSDKYTVNGEEKTMDTELTIVDGRTYVPVRFVADELGYQITVLKDAQGLTAGVVFQK